MLWDTLSDTKSSISTSAITCKFDIYSYHTTKGISAAIASSIPAAARGGLQSILYQHQIHPSIIDSLRLR